ncbi:asparaginase domain-containing protein [Intrasporangium calvum]|uniref:asparaginase domain-containing protein n=1 Tax=Intrasporangium calvum TaxID=53358 RepID=UPI000DF63E98|nr:asparaginase domain-containing protein [Intrasporangium calvum]AXG14527.1 asparaginase [Intrasporangium calvum]
MATVVLTTGGTIASRRRGDATLVAVDAAAEVVANAGVVEPDVRVEEFCRIGSYALTLPLLAALAERVRQLCAEPGVEGIVVTHGTDTMEESAYLTDLGHTRRTAVVFTGAQLSADHPRADGPANLRDAVLLAKNPEVARLGVLIAMAGRAYAAAEATKAHSTALDPWGAAGTMPLAVVSEGRVIVARRPDPTPVPIVIPPERAARRVDLVKLAVGVDGELVRAAVAGGAEALVVEAFGLGNAPRDVTAAIGEAVAAGVPVAVVTRCGAGPAAGVYGDGGGADLERAGALMLSGFTGQRARILLAVALAAADSRSTALELVRTRMSLRPHGRTGSEVDHEEN